ncbi:heparinase II/III family protein [Metabacillus malikii]|uniref:Heparinase II/III-like protein n=1 Tax=Metabacillus malikii TaxID=1504265 RepID=A0ABT9ZC64_9BACI|nr:heparinase II/III family protein [Metabacillus malikii]MDQ0229855.1 hypothetical protein [Metabacillus malikii]
MYKGNILKGLLREGKDAPLIFKNIEEMSRWVTKIKNKKGLQPLLIEINNEAERLLSEKENELTFTLFQQFEQTGSRLEYEKVYFEKRRRLGTFALMSLLEPDEDMYKKQLENIIWSILNEYTWCLPAHLTNRYETSKLRNSQQEKNPPAYTIDLFSAETAFALSEILTLTKDWLSPLIMRRIEEEIDRRVFQPFLLTPQHWETATHNWAAVCGGSIGSAALHLLENEEDLSTIMERILATMDYYLEGFHDDGTCLEGYRYWQYGFGFYVYFADLLKRRTLDKMNLFNNEKVHAIALFQQKTFLYKNKVVNFSDAQQEESIFLGLTHYLHSIYEDVHIPENKLRASYTDDHCSRWAPAFRNLLWYQDDLQGKPWENETYFLSESQWFISRYATTSGHFAFAAKGGHNDEPHNHNDLGHFILLRNNEVFLKDLGAGLYSADYFGKKRYDFICNSSFGHSVPIINQQGQQLGNTAFATILSTTFHHDKDTLILDLTNSYDLPFLKQYQRSFTWEKTTLPKLIIEDIFHFDEQPNQLVERMIVPNRVVVKEIATGLELQGTETLYLHFDTNSYKVTIEQFEFTDHFGRIQLNKMIDIKPIAFDYEMSIKLVFQFH